jgi:two-component sensor histidine kinase
MIANSKRIRIRALKGRKTYFEDLIELQLNYNKLQSKLECNKSETDSIISKLKSKNNELEAELIIRQRERDELDKRINEISKLVDNDLTKINSELNLKIEKISDENNMLRKLNKKIEGTYK